MRPIDQFYLQKDEPLKSSLLFLRDFILNFDPEITEAWKYGMPFFCYRGKMFCYLWVNKKTHKPYIGIVEGRKLDHPLLLIEKRSRMKIMLLDDEADLPIDLISEVLTMAINLYRNK